LRTPAAAVRPMRVQCPSVCVCVCACPRTVHKAPLAAPPRSRRNLRRRSRREEAGARRPEGRRARRFAEKRPAARPAQKRASNGTNVFGFVLLFSRRFEPVNAREETQSIHASGCAAATARRNGRGTAHQPICSSRAHRMHPPPHAPAHVCAHTRLLRSSRLPIAQAPLRRLQKRKARQTRGSSAIEKGCGVGHARAHVHSASSPSNARTCSAESRRLGLICARASSSARRSRMMTAYSSMLAVAASQELRPVTSGHNWPLLFAFFALLQQERARASPRGRHAASDHGRHTRLMRDLLTGAPARRVRAHLLFRLAGDGRDLGASGSRPLKHQEASSAGACARPGARQDTQPQNMSGTQRVLATRTWLNRSEARELTGLRGGERPIAQARTHHVALPARCEHLRGLRARAPPAHSQTKYAVSDSAPAAASAPRRAPRLA
jgi:hypothetical protein